MKCMHCQAEMERGTTVFHIDRKDLHVSLDRAPAWVCPQCGEVYFEAKDVEQMQDLARTLDDKAREMETTG